MRKFILLTLVIMVSFVTVSTGQRNDRNAYTEYRSENRQEMRHGKTECHKGKKYHKRKMRKIAAADGKITPRERKILKKERRNIY